MAQQASPQQLASSLIAGYIAAANWLTLRACVILHREGGLPVPIVRIVGSFLLWNNELAILLDTGIVSQAGLVFMRIIPQPEDYIDDGDSVPEPTPNFEVSVGLVDAHDRRAIRVILTTNLFHASDVWRWLQGEGAIDIRVLSCYESKVAEDSYSKELPKLAETAAALLHALKRRLFSCD